MKVGLIEIILFIVFAQLLLLSFYLLFGYTKRTISIKILAVFLFSKAMCISAFLSFRLWEYTFNYFPHIIYFGISFSLLWGPMLYLYTKSLSQPKFHFRKSYFIHTLPFAFLFLYFFFNYHIYSAEAKRYIIDAGKLMPHWGSNLVNWFLYVSLLFYLIASWHCIWLYKHQKVKKYNLSADSLSWLLIVVIGFTFKWGLDCWYTIQSSITHTKPMLPLLLSRIDLIVFTNIMVFKGMKSPNIFSLDEMNANKRHSLSKRMSDKYLEILNAKMGSEKYFLDMEITLLKLSKLTGIPHRSLSEIINDKLGQKFFDYINTSRIKEAQRIFSDPDSPFQTILEVMYEVGFNNKTSFNSYFKQITGMTPTEYKRRCSVHMAYS